MYLSPYRVFLTLENNLPLYESIFKKLVDVINHSNTMKIIYFLSKLLFLVYIIPSVKFNLRSSIFKIIWMMQFKRHNNKLLVFLFCLNVCLIHFFTFSSLRSRLGAYVYNDIRSRIRFRWTKIIVNNFLFNWNYRNSVLQLLLIFFSMLQVYYENYVTTT